MIRNVSIKNLEDEQYERLLEFLLDLGKYSTLRRQEMEDICIKRGYITIDIIESGGVKNDTKI